MLTQKQKDLLIFIHERLQKGDIAPSFEEMKDHLNLASKSGIHRLITGLVERGFLRRLPHRARALEIIRLPESYDQPNSQDNTTDAFSPPVSSANNNVQTSNFNRDVEDVPLYGKIAAGTPISAIRHEGDTVSVPAFLLGSSEYYALTVEGDSMTGAGIQDSDIVIIEKSTNPKDGDIVVALVDDDEVTLKTLKREGNTVLLIPENPTHDIRVLDASRVQFQGKLASLFRTYH